jgi:hypothetical protein
MGNKSFEVVFSMKNSKKEENKKLLDELKKSNPLLITDLSRK